MQSTLLIGLRVQTDGGHGYRWIVVVNRLWLLKNSLRRVFRRLRYDNLKSAVKKILRGYQREETSRLIAFRSHWGFASLRRYPRSPSASQSGLCRRRSRTRSASAR